jgi:hypothetical protein
LFIVNPVYIAIAVVVALAVYFLFAAKRAARSDTKPVGRRAKPATKPGKDEDEEVGQEAPAPAAPHKSAVEQMAPGTAPRTQGQPRVSAADDERSSFKYRGKTVLFYDPSHGNQLEYYDPNGRCYLWYPGNRGVVAGEWRVEGEYLCFRYGTNTYNPVTREHGGDWERTLLRRWGTDIVDAAPGDVCGLATERIPYCLSRHPAFQSVYDAKHGVPAPDRDLPVQVRSEKKGVQPGAPCPCGSGRSFSQCHGAADLEEQ